MDLQFLFPTSILKTVESDIIVDVEEYCDIDLKRRTP